MQRRVGISYILFTWHFLASYTTQNSELKLQKVQFREANSSIIYVLTFIYLFSGTGSISSGSAKSISTFRSESRLDESFSSSASFPNSPATQRRFVLLCISVIV